MVLVHDRVPDMKTYPPLPDIVLDNLPLIPWHYSSHTWVREVYGTFRVVIMRRMFSLVGTVFLLRCVTMMITSLSVPGKMGSSPMIGGLYSIIAACISTTAHLHYNG
uniref:Uncharacterized protein n=1 Tax=Parascaris equorum TaxID=6256 RepID=A0A914R8Y5_PAREQ